jgi:LDH2 family malate/lactate/ureidoglycolate dehydrogenase
MGAEQGFLVMVWSNTDAGMAFPGRSHRQIGNNPLGWGLGTGAAALSADLCLAYSSLGNLNAMAASGDEAPQHWGRGPDGVPTTDPKKLLAGAVEPIGGPKGLALALLGEVLTGVLTGGATLDEVAPGGGLRTHNQMVLAFDLAWFGGKGIIEDRIVSLKRRARQDGAMDRLPGDRSRAAEAKASSEGIPIQESLESSLRDWSDRLQVAVPEA